MEKKDNSLLISAILLVIGILGVLTYFIVSYFKKKEQDIVDTSKLAGLDTLKIGHEKNVIAAIPKKDRKKAQESLKNFDVKRVADIIYNSHSLANDDEDAVYSGFGMLENKAQLSLLNLYFKGLYKIDLFEYLKSFLDTDELAKIYKIVSRLKNA